MKGIKYRNDSLRHFWELDFMFDGYEPSSMWRQVSNCCLATLKLSVIPGKLNGIYLKVPK